MTDVRSEISSSGWLFAIICCLCGSWIVSCLVKCLPGFRKFTHLCPHCKSLLGVGEPKHTSEEIALISVATILVIGLIAAYIYFRAVYHEN